ncbi:MAG: hypothetical protein VX658_02800, partial [Pseudomonadota bacterium]|nr:hypothetical protein [Pseudomonadota bacterium]
GHGQGELKHGPDWYPLREHSKLVIMKMNNGQFFHTWPIDHMNNALVFHTWPIVHMDNCS